VAASRSILTLLPSSAMATTTWFEMNMSFQRKFQAPSSHYRCSSNQYGSFYSNPTLMRSVSGSSLPQLTTMHAPAPSYQRWNLENIFAQFDTDGDGVLTLGEFQRAFRALGLKKRSGAKMSIDQAMFDSFDTNGDGVVSLAELNENLKPKTRAKIEQKLDEGWVFDQAKWEASIARHSRWDMSKVFKQFDFDGDGYLTMGELQRAFRALGLKKRNGTKMKVDEAMFQSFDTNGDGVVSLEEFEANLLPKTRKKIEDRLNAGWKFDPAKWADSLARHQRWDLSKVFKQFDVDGDGKLNIGELKRAFRALGLKKRNGAALEMDQAMFDSFDTNGDGFVSLRELEQNMYPKTRKKIEAKLDAGWKFDATAWLASVARHSTWNMAKVFKNFDTDNDGYLDKREFMRAFRALGLKKRSGSDMKVDMAMFDSFDTNGDGVVSLEEFEANLLPKTRAKIEAKLNEGWKFDPELWAASQARHANDPM